jgi:polar amino acid transport system permease protein
VNFDVKIFWDFLFNPFVVDGAKLTLLLSIVCQFMGVVIGLFIALARISTMKLPLLRWVSGFYLWFFRGTPLLVQLFFVYAALPQLTNQTVKFGSITSAFIALSLNEGAYMAEIIRAGISAVDTGQLEAAKALGMTYPLTMRRIVLPQAVRFVIPPTGNEFISMLKNTSLAAVIAAPELFYQVQQIYSSNLAIFELLTVASVWYLAMTTLATYVQSKLEGRAEYRRIPTRRRLIPFQIPGMKRA